MSDQLLPDFDGPQDLSDPTKPRPKKPRPRPQRKQLAKKTATRRGPPPAKPAKRVSKKRRVRNVSPIFTETPTLLLPDEAYKLIRGLMGMSKTQLTLVLEIVHKLTK